MHVCFGGRDWEVVVHDPAATVADLAAATGVDLVRLTGLGADGALATAGIWRGTDLGQLPRRCGDAGALTFAVVEGLDAGRRTPVAPGAHVVGRGHGVDVLVADATVSRRHAALFLERDGTVDLVDLGSRNGSWLRRGDDAEEAVTPGERAVRVDRDTAVRIGASEVVVAVPVDDTPVASLSPRSTIAGTAPQTAHRDQPSRHPCRQPRFPSHRRQQQGHCPWASSPSSRRSCSPR